jgi:hypothetical protein
MNITEIGICFFIFCKVGVTILAFCVTMIVKKLFGFTHYQFSVLNSPDAD